MRFLLLLAFAAIGCGGSAPEPVAPSPSPDPPSSSAAPAPPPPPPAPTPPPPPPPEPVANDEPPPPAADPTPPPKPVEPPVEGTIRAHKGHEVTIKLGGTPPQPGTKGSLEKFFEGKAGDKSPLGALGAIFGGQIQGWLRIAEVTVKKVDKDLVVFTIDAES